MSVASSTTSVHALGLDLAHATGLPTSVASSFCVLFVVVALLALLAAALMYRRLSRLTRKTRHQQAELQSIHTGFSLDVTEQIEATRKLEDQIGRNDALIRALGEIVYERDIDEDTIEWSGAVESTLGLNASEAGATAQVWLQNIHAGDRARVVAHFNAVVEDQTSFNIEYRFRHRDGHYVWIGDRGVSRRRPDTNHRTLIGVMEDIGYRKHYEELITGYTDKLQRSNKELQQFAYVASHDLQEPLRKIIAFGDLLKSRAGGELPEDMQMCVDRMQNSALRMRTFIEDLLQYSRVHTKKSAAETVDLNATAATVQATLEMLIAESGAILDIDNLAPVCADPAQVHQLIQNLISNALKYRNKGQTPVVSMRTRKLTARLVELTVSDNGIGFEAKFADRIFDPFQRLHSRDEYEGSGMGLAICRRIVETHGGTISAKGHPGEGACFTLTLPAA